MQVSDYQVQTLEGWRHATLVHDRERSRVLLLEGGKDYAKLVKGSACVREDPGANRELAVWLARSRRSWEHLRQQTHPGLLRVGERVIDNYGDEGYLCQALTVHELDDPQHPARRNLRAFLECAIQLSRAVGVMHRAGFVHGDITPGNVCFYQERPVLIDFEMTVKIGQYVSVEARDPHYRKICCTPECCSPEQILRRPVTPASDVYCLGLTLLSWASKVFGVADAFPKQSTRDSMGLCARADYPHWDVVETRLKEADVISVLGRAIQLVPWDRYPNGDSLAEDLEGVLEELPDGALAQSLDEGSASALDSSNNLTFCLEHT